MKIKKIFGLATIASLAILMTACGKPKNETIFNASFFDQEAIKLEDYENETKAKKEVVEISNKLTYYAYQGGIFIGYDDTFYHIYNLSMEGKEILTVNVSDVTNISIDQNYYYIAIRYDYNDDNDYAYEFYNFAGDLLAGKAYMDDYTVGLWNSYNFHDGGLSLKTANEYRLDYTVKEDGFYVNKRVFFYRVSTSSSSNYNSEVEFLNAEDYYEKYGKIKNDYMDGAIVGLKGYKLANSGEALLIFKNDTFVNSAVIASTIISDGYSLLQTRQTVSANEKYDISYEGVYYKINTYKISLLNSKMTKLNGFHYFINSYESIVYKDGIIDSCLCEVVDFKEKKLATSIDVRLALIKGNGSIKVHEAMGLAEGKIYSDKDTYYAYKTANSYTDDESTIIYDKKGNVKAFYNGIYYNDVLAKKNISDMSFVDKNGKVVYVLYNYERIAFDRYIGEDIYGNSVLVQLSNGEVEIVDINAYAYNENYFTKVDSTTRTFYSLDKSLDKFSFECTTSDQISYLSYDIYRINYSDGTTKLISFK